MTGGLPRWKRLHSVSRRMACDVIRGNRPDEDPRVAITSLKPRREWAVGNSPNHSMHLVDRCWAGWVEGRIAFAAARMKCGGAQTDVTFHSGPDRLNRKICVACTASGHGRFVIYRLFGFGGRLLYIGVTSDINARFRSHAHPSGSGWWSEVCDRRYEFFATREAALAAERAAIRTEYPVYNCVHARRGPRHV